MTDKIGKFLTNRLEKKNMTRYQVHKLTGIDQTALGRIFSGEREPGIISFMKICKALTVTKSEIYELLKSF
jgi:transcriptional regulator with XRE-family HTH domain